LNIRLPKPIYYILTLFPPVVAVVVVVVVVVVVRGGKGNGKGKVVPVYTKKAHRQSRCIAPLILNLGGISDTTVWQKNECTGLNVDAELPQRQHPFCGTEYVFTFRLHEDCTDAGKAVKHVKKQFLKLRGI
jgi:hypothetical protein